MTQRRWLKLIVNYNINLQYHSDKINLVLNVLSRKSKAIFLTQKKESLEEMRRLDLGVSLPRLEVQLLTLQLQSTLHEKIKVG